MISIDPTLLIIIGEVMLALVVVIVVILVLFIKSKRRDQSAAQTLQGKINSNVSQRQALFENMLAGSEDEAEEDAAKRKEMAATWVNKENEFYGRLVDMYLKRNATALKGLDKLLHEYTSSYLDLVTLMRDRVESGQVQLSQEAQQRLERMVEEGERLDGRVKSLEGENRILNKELKDAYREIEQTMREYTKAFRPGGASAAGVASVAGSLTGQAVAEAPQTPTTLSADLENDEVNDDDVADLAEALGGFPELGAKEESEGGEAPDAESLPDEDVVADAPPVSDETESILPEGEPAADMPEILDEEAFFSQGVEEKAEQQVSADTPLLADDAGAEGGRGPVIDLADEGDIVLPELGDVVSGGGEVPDSDETILGEVLDEVLAGATDNAGAEEGGAMIDEDDLLAQLEGMEQDGDVTGLSESELVDKDKRSADSG